MVISSCLPEAPAPADRLFHGSTVALNLEHKVALITGGSRGIGRAIAEAYAAHGAKVVISSRRRISLEQAAAQIGGDVAWFEANAGDGQAARACVEYTLERFGGLDILVNNAATNPHFGPVLDIEQPAAVKTVGVNLVGPVLWSQAAWRAVMQWQGGCILNIASVGGLIVEPDIGFYNVTKAALIHLTRQLADELAPGVRVNAIAPGLVRTDMARALWEKQEAQMAARHPLGRIGEVDDIAQAALYLTSDLSSWVTGHTLVIDGGASLGRTSAPSDGGTAHATDDRDVR